MSPSRRSLLDLAILLSVFLIHPHTSLAQSATTSSSFQPSSAATSTYSNVFSAIASSNPNGGNFGVQPGNVASDPTNTAGSNAAGAAGSSDDSSINLSTGAMIAIIVVVCVVVIIGATTAVLFYLAKKRKWRVRESIGRFGRPKTPLSAKFPPNSARSGRSNRGMVRIDPPSRTHPISDAEKTPIMERERRRRDLESNWPGAKKGKGKVGETPWPIPHPSPGPKSAFDMDSPLNTQGKGWGRMSWKR